MNGYEMDTYERPENSTWPITKFVALLRNQLTATQFVRSFENLAPGLAGTYGIERELASRADQRVFRWFGHVERMDEYRRPEGF